MGTNFYWRAPGYESPCDGDEPTGHIGKRSAAGAYCWDCGVSLCHGGNTRVHTVRGFYDACPQCGAERVKETMCSGAAGRELGFNKSEPAPKKGVRSCSSFSWAMDPEHLELMAAKSLAFEMKCPTCHQELATDSHEDAEKVIRDEYGRMYTLEKFRAVLSECPIQFTDSVGSCFS